jgi:hypothetical protein
MVNALGITGECEDVQCEEHDRSRSPLAGKRELITTTKLTGMTFLA